MVNDTPKEQDGGFQEVKKRKNDRMNSGIVIREPDPSKLTNENLSVVQGKGKSGANGVNGLTESAPKHHKAKAKPPRESEHFETAPKRQQEVTDIEKARRGNTKEVHNIREEHKVRNKQLDNQQASKTNRRKTKKKKKNSPLGRSNSGRGRGTVNIQSTKGTS